MQDGREPGVALVISSFHPRVGGGETHARILGRELVRLGVPVTVFTRAHDSALPRSDAVDGVPVVRVGPSGHPRLGKYLMLLPVLAALLRQRHDYDIVYICGLRVLGIAGVLASILLRKPCILRAEACGELSGDFIYASPHGGGNKHRANPLIRLALGARNALFRKATRFLSISGVIRDEFIACGVPPGRIAHIPNGIELDPFQPADASTKAALRRELNLPDGFLFAYSGKLNRGKGLEMLLRVWSVFAKRHTNARLVLIGAGGQQFLSCEAELKAFVAEHELGGSVVFTGYTQRVGDHLRACDAFVFPSENEALGLALLEAMACGLPSIASATGGILDIVSDRRNGRLAPVGDETAWLNAMNELIGNPAPVQAWAAAGRATVQENFDILQVAKAHRDLFRSIRTK